MKKRSVKYFGTAATAALVVSAVGPIAASAAVAPQDGFYVVNEETNEKLFFTIDQLLGDSADQIIEAINAAGLENVYLYQEGTLITVQGLFDGEEVAEYEEGDIPAGEYTDSEGEKVPVGDEVDPIVELTVKSVSAITATTVTVGIDAPTEDLVDQTVVVKDGTGKEYAVSPTTIKAGATTATFTFVTPLTVSPTAAWTVDGVAYEVEKFEITNVERLTSNSKYLNVQFNSVLDTLDASEVSVRNKTTQQAYGVDTVRLAADKMAAQVTLLGGDNNAAVLSPGQVYTLSITQNGEVTSFEFEVPGVAPERVVTGYNKTNQTLTIAGYGALKVPTTLAVDYEDLVGRDVTAWYNKDGEITRLVPVEQTVKYDGITIETRNGVTYVKALTENKEYVLNKDAVRLVKGTNGYEASTATAFDYAKLVFNNAGEVKTIAAIDNLDINASLLVESINGSVVKSYGSEFNLKDYTILKNGKTATVADVKAGDAIFYNTTLKVAEVYNGTKSGAVDAVYQGEIKVAGVTYTVGAAKYVNRDGKLVALDQNGLDALKASGKDVTLYFDHNNVLVYVAGELGKVATQTAIEFLTADVKNYEAKAEGYLIIKTQDATGTVKTHDFPASQLTSVVNGSNKYKVGYELNGTNPTNTNATIKEIYLDAKALKYKTNDGTSSTIVADVTTLADESVFEVITDAEGKVTGLTLRTLNTVSATASLKVTDKVIQGKQVSASTPVFVFTRNADGTVKAVKSTTWGQLDPATSNIDAYKYAVNDKNTDIAYLTILEGDIKGPTQVDTVETVVKAVSKNAKGELAELTLFHNGEFVTVDLSKIDSGSKSANVAVGDIVTATFNKETNQLRTISAEDTASTGLVGKIDTNEASHVQLGENKFTVTKADTTTEDVLISTANVKVFEVVKSGTGSSEVTTVESRGLDVLTSLKADNELSISYLAGSSSTPKYVDTIVITKNKDAASTGGTGGTGGSTVSFEVDTPEVTLANTTTASTVSVTATGVNFKSNVADFTIVSGTSASVTPSYGAANKLVLTVAAGNVAADETVTVKVLKDGMIAATEDATVSFKIKANVVSLADGSVAGATAGNTEITALTTNRIYKVTEGSNVFYTKADGTLTATASEKEALGSSGTKITGLENGKTYKVELLNNAAELTSSDLTIVTNAGTSTYTIAGTKADYTDLDAFKAALTIPAGATVELLQTDASTDATDLDDLAKVKVVSEDGTLTLTYTVTLS